MDGWRTEDKIGVVAGLYEEENPAGSMDRQERQQLEPCAGDSQRTDE